MKFEEGEMTVPDVLRKDVLWTVKLSKAAGMRSLSDQLYRSCGSICANLEEGYSKNRSKDRSRFYECSLGSARETRGWFYRARPVLRDSPEYIVKAIPDSEVLF